MLYDVKQGNIIIIEKRRSAMSYKIAICDDAFTDLHYIQQCLHEWANHNHVPISVDSFSSAESFLFHYTDQKDYDIVLLDIEMKEMNGITLAKKIRQSNPTVQIIFISGYSDYICDGYDVEALHYLLKPLDKEKLFSVLNRALKKIEQNEKCIFINVNNEMFQIPLYEIYYIDVQSNYITIHAQHDITIKKTLKELEKDLNEHFLRVGRSLIINLRFVRRVTKSSVYLSNNTILPIPRNAYEKINRAIIQYM